jgi:hypothetical protein
MILVDAARVRISNTGPSVTVRDDVVLPADMADSVTLFGCSIAQGSSYSRPNIVQSLGQAQSRVRVERAVSRLECRKRGRGPFLRNSIVASTLLRRLVTFITHCL